MAWPSTTKESAQLSSSGFANIEHYFNNTASDNDGMPIVFIAASVSRAAPGQPGEWRITRTGGLGSPLSIRYALSGVAIRGRDYQEFKQRDRHSGGACLHPLQLLPAASARDGKTTIITLESSQTTHHIGRHSASWIVIRNGGL